MQFWIERYELFHNAILAALCAGLVCPLLGAFLYVRRTSFYGITLPQFATAGVALGFVVLPWWAERVGIGGLDPVTAQSDTHAAMNYHVTWAALFTFGGLLLLDWRARRSGNDVGRVAAAFAIAVAATYLFSRYSPIGASFVGELTEGEVLGVGEHELHTIAWLLGSVAALFVLFHRDLTLISFDREMAQVLGVRVVALETLLTLVTGLTISVGTMTLGPTILFGLLVLPPIAARAWATSMTRYLLLSSAFGAMSVLLGIAASFQFDWPLGPAVVAAAALVHVPGLSLRRSAR